MRKEIPIRKQFNVWCNEEEFKVLHVLMDEYSININGCFKIFLKKYLEQLKNKDIKLEI